MTDSKRLVSDVSRLQKDIARLQQEMAQLKSPRARRLHQIFTVPPAVPPNVSTLTPDWMCTQYLSMSQLYRVHLAPLEFDGVIDVRRISATVELNAAGTAQFGLAIYRMLNPERYDAGAIDPEASLPSFERIAVLGRFSSDSFGAYEKKDVDLAADLRLDSQAGHYFVGFQSDSTKAQWMCPVGGSLLKGRRTTPHGSEFGDFPAELMTSRQGLADVPSFCLRSALGVRLFAVV